MLASSGTVVPPLYIHPDEPLVSGIFRYESTHSHEHHPLAFHSLPAIDKGSYPLGTLIESRWRTLRLEIRLGAEWFRGHIISPVSLLV